LGSLTRGGKKRAHDEIDTLSTGGGIHNHQGGEAYETDNYERMGGTMDKNLLRRVEGEASRGEGSSFRDPEAVPGPERGERKGRM